VRPHPPIQRKGTARRLFLFFTSLTLVYPLFSFLRYKTPRQPRIIKLHLDLKPGEFHIEPTFVLFEDGHAPWAVSRKCTHLGCTIQFHAQERFFECPCHQSRFSEKGLVLKGPAQKNLPLFKVEKPDGQNFYLVTL